MQDEGSRDVDPPAAGNRCDHGAVTAMSRRWLINNAARGPRSVKDRGLDVDEVAHNAIVVPRLRHSRDAGTRTASVCSHPRWRGLQCAPVRVPRPDRVPSTSFRQQPRANSGHNGRHIDVAEGDGLTRLLFACAGRPPKNALSPALETPEGAGTAQPFQVAGLIDAIHAFPVAQARDCGVPEWNLRGDFTDDLEQVRTDLVPLLTPQAARTLLSVWEDYLADDANFDFAPTLVHADVAVDHLLVTDARISGLIDFGDVAIGDPDYDLSYLFAGAGPAFVRRVQEHRGRPLSDRLVAKLRFWSLADPANDVLHGVENDLPGFRDRSLRLLHERLASAR
ncbi:phosphotransferase [Actinoplanes sp. NPDC023936]|uniref:phosphotransferase n=1 Tax=Actinoplanes sp. NPDC023936 TaxID=3154910 RepID=UPI0033FB1D78